MLAPIPTDHNFCYKCGTRMQFVFKGHPSYGFNRKTGDKLPEIQEVYWECAIMETFSCDSVYLGPKDVQCFGSNPNLT